MNLATVRLAIAAWTRGMRQAQRQYEKVRRGRGNVRRAHPEAQRCTRCGECPGPAAFDISPKTGATYPRCRSCREEAQEKTAWRQTHDLAALRQRRRDAAKRSYYNRSGRAFTQPSRLRENAARLAAIRAKWAHVTRLDRRIVRGTQTCRRAHATFISKLALYELWDRQNGLCYYSGEPLSCDPGKTHLGHIVPVARGGKTEISNLCWLSDWSNKMQSDQTYDEMLARCRLLLANERPTP